MPDPSDKIVTVCTACHANLKLDIKYLGNRIRCPKCQSVFEVQAIKMGDDALASQEALATSSDVTAPAAFSQTEPQENSNPAYRVKSQSASSPRTSRPDEKRTGAERTLGRYLIDEELGRGAFGVVYAATDPILNRRVAIKVPTRPADEASFEKMLLEARVAARLRHPHIVAVYEVVTDQQQPFVVSELIDGQSLAEAIESGTLEPRQAVTIVRDIARGLAYAHEEGLVHRDVKPANILLDSTGRSQLTDFGLAVDRTDELQRDAASYSRSGTLAYMAPEQAGIGAASVGPAVDQYALAATLFEMLCGQRPHTGDAVEIISGLEKPEPPHLRSVAADQPIDLDAICFKAMAHEPWQRYEDCQALADDLDRFLDGELIHGRKIGLVERARHYAKKHPKLAAWTTGGVIAASALLLTSTGIVAKQIFFSNPTPAQAAGNNSATSLQPVSGNSANTSNNGLGALDVDGDAVDATAAQNPTWVAYSRKLNSAARLDSIGDHDLYGKLLDESPKTVRDWEHRHLEARKRLGLLTTIPLDANFAAQVIAGNDGLSCLVRYRNSSVVQHISIRDGSTISQFDAENNSAVAAANQSEVVFFTSGNSIKRWNYQNKQPGASIDLPFKISELQISLDDQWLYARSRDGSFALVNSSTGQVVQNTKLRHLRAPIFSNDSSCLGIAENQQLSMLHLGKELNQMPAGLTNTANVNLLALVNKEGRSSFYYAEQASGKWLLRRDMNDLTLLDMYPNSLRIDEESGDVTLLSFFPLTLVTLKSATLEVARYPLLSQGYVDTADISDDGRLVFAVQNKQLYVWDTKLLVPQSNTHPLGLVSSYDVDDTTGRSVVSHGEKVSLVDIENGNVVWSRANDK